MKRLTPAQKRVRFVVWVLLMSRMMPAEGRSVKVATVVERTTAKAAGPPPLSAQ